VYFDKICGNNNINKIKRIAPFALLLMIIRYAEIKDEKNTIKSTALSAGRKYPRNAFIASHIGSLVKIEKRLLASYISNSMIGEL